MAVARAELMAWFSEMLDLSIDDWCYNGLQFEGRAEVSRIVAGVSASQAFIDEACAGGADLLLVHHGLIWGKVDRIEGALRRRIQPLVETEANLVAFHLPLDAHASIGNNSLMANLLGATGSLDRFAEAGGTRIGVAASFDKEVGWDDFVAKVATLTGHAGTPRPPLHLGPTPPAVRRVAICSGGGGKYAHEAAATGADVYITGEPSEPTMDDASEAGIAVLAAGHWATEVFGVRELARHAAEHFGLEHEFLALENPV